MLRRQHKPSTCGARYGIKIIGILTNNLRYADDTVVIGELPADNQVLINRIIECSEVYGLSLLYGMDALALKRIEAFQIMWMYCRIRRKHHRQRGNQKG